MKDKPNTSNFPPFVILFETLQQKRALQPFLDQFSNATCAHALSSSGLSIGNFYADTLGKTPHFLVGKYSEREINDVKATVFHIPKDFAALVAFLNNPIPDKGRVSVPLTLEYTATWTEGDADVKVGYQSIPVERVIELAEKIQKIGLTPS